MITLSFKHTCACMIYRQTVTYLYNILPRMLGIKKKVQLLDRFATENNCSRQAFRLRFSFLWMWHAKGSPGATMRREGGTFRRKQAPCSPLELCPQRHKSVKSSMMSTLGILYYSHAGNEFLY